jgi:hypothetical protein
MLGETLGGGIRILLGPKAIAKCLDEYWRELYALGFSLECGKELLVGYQAKLLEHFDVELALPPLQNIIGDSAEPEREAREGSGG